MSDMRLTVEIFAKANLGPGLRYTQKELAAIQRRLKGLTIPVSVAKGGLAQLQQYRRQLTEMNQQLRVQMATAFPMQKAALALQVMENEKLLFLTKSRIDLEKMEGVELSQQAKVQRQKNLAEEKRERDRLRQLQRQQVEQRRVNAQQLGVSSALAHPLWGPVLLGRMGPNTTPREAYNTKKLLDQERRQREEQSQHWRNLSSGFSNAAMTTGVAGLAVGGTLFAAAQAGMDWKQTDWETAMALRGPAMSWKDAQGHRQIRSWTIGEIREYAQQLDAITQRVSEQVGFLSAPELAHGFKAFATSGTATFPGGVDQMLGDKGIMSSVGRFMDIMQRFKGEGPEQAGQDAARMLHLWAAYTPDAATRVLDATSVMAMQMPDSLSRSVMALSYSMPTGVALGHVSPIEIASLTATFDQMGLGLGRSGARSAAMLMGGLFDRTPAAQRAKKHLGLTSAQFYDGDQFNLSRYIELVGQRLDRQMPHATLEQRKQAWMEFLPDLHAAFGTQAQTVLGMFADPKRRQLFQNVLQQQKDAVHIGFTGLAQYEVLQGPMGDYSRMVKKYANVFAELGTAVIPVLADISRQLTDFMRSLSPEQIHSIGKSLVYLAGGLIALSAVSGIASIFTAVMSFFIALRPALVPLIPLLARIAPLISADIVPALGTLGPALLRLLGPIGIIIAAASMYQGKPAGPIIQKLQDDGTLGLLGGQNVPMLVKPPPTLVGGFGIDPTDPRNLKLMPRDTRFGKTVNLGGWDIHVQNLNITTNARNHEELSRDIVNHVRHKAATSGGNPGIQGPWGTLNLPHTH